MAESPQKTRLRWKDNILIGFNKRGTASPNELKWLKIDGSCKKDNGPAGSVKQRLSKYAGSHKN